MSPVLHSISPDFPVASSASDRSVLPFSAEGLKRNSRGHGVLSRATLHSLEGLQTVRRLLS
jgi:hypothetical protein